VILNNLNNNSIIHISKYSAKITGISHKILTEEICGGIMFLPYAVEDNIEREKNS
jgi:hypothetical protein